MRVNQRVFTERSDMLGGIKIPNCPTQFKAVAENIMNMVTKLDYSVGDYNTVTELDKILMIDYWNEYDDFGYAWGISINNAKAFNDWFIHKATNPDLITRARRWLVEHHYLFLKESVAERAYEAEEKFRVSVKH